ncbi:HotDog domain-containing protein [Cytidiella melzeri]|nr:HotDog domain-containing protein [Cytidiella melzeri]
MAGRSIATSLLNVRGNVSDDARNAMAKWSNFMCDTHYFGNDMVQRLVAVEMNVSEVDDRKKAKMVFELDVTEDLCNAIGSLHGGCTAALVDQCTSMAIALLSQYISPGEDIHVSVALNTTFHTPAPLGTQIKIVSTTIAYGSRTRTARAEIYENSRNRLVATGTHVKMVPSGSKL